MSTWSLIGVLRGHRLWLDISHCGPGETSCAVADLERVLGVPRNLLKFL